MLIGGTLLSAVVRIVVLAATLALVYVFIVKPVLHTTEVGINSANDFSDNISKSFDVTNDKSYKQAMRQMNHALKDANVQTGQVQIYSGGKTNVKASDQQRLLKCVQNSVGNVNRMVRCNEKFGP